MTTIKNPGDIDGILKKLWLVVSTHLKNISQNGNLPHIWNHHLELLWVSNQGQLVTAHSGSFMCNQMVTRGRNQGPRIQKKSTKKKYENNSN